MKWRYGVVGAALAAALILCVPDLLMPRLRAFYQDRFPEVAAQWPLDGSYTVISPFDDTDGGEYGGRVAEAARTLVPGDPYIAENSSLRLKLTDTALFMFAGLCVRAAGGFNRGWTLARFLGGFAWFLLIYALVARVSKNRRWAVACAALGTLFCDLAYVWILPSSLSSLKTLVYHLYFFLGDYMYYLGASRVANPALTYPPLFLAAYLAIETAQSRRWPAAAAAGLAGGLLAYVHGDVFTTYVVGMALYALLQGGREVRASFALALLVSVPWLATHFPVDADQAARAGVFTGRAPNLLGLAWFGVFGLSLKFWRKDPGMLLLGCLAAGAGAWTQTQLLTGQVVQPGNWNYLGFTFSALFAAGWLGRRLPDRRDWLWAALVLGVWGMGRGVGYASLRFRMQGLTKDMDQVFAFLNRETPAGSVVATLAPVENLLIPIHTRNKVLIGGAFILASDLSTEQYMRRQRLAMELLGIPERAALDKVASPEFLEAFPRWNRDLWRGKLDWNERQWASFWNYTHTMTQREFVERFQAAGTLPEGAARVDYLLTTPFDRALMPASAQQRLGRPLFKNATYALYSSVRSGSTK